MKTYVKEFAGEWIGTYLMVLFGCGAVAVSVLFKQYDSILQIAAVWGIAVTIAIYATGDLCCAHFNPAVSLAMTVTGRMSPRKLPAYLTAQFTGAFAAALSLYGLFGSNIAIFEKENHLIRGTAGSALSAKMFGEYYQNLSGASQPVSMPLAMAAEALGTFILVFMIFALTEGCNTKRPQHNTAPIFIGMTLAMVICLLAPLTQAGFNPARDFAPRMAAFLLGWGEAAFPDHSGGFFFVYMLSPVIGGIAAGLVFEKVIRKLMEKQGEDDCCCKKEQEKEGEKSWEQICY